MQQSNGQFIHISLPELALVAAASACFAAAFWMRLRRLIQRGDGAIATASPPAAMQGEPAAPYRLPLFTTIAGTLACAVVLTWRAIAAHRFSLPLSDGFDAFILLVLLLALLWLYFQASRNADAIRGPAMLLLPTAAALLLLAGGLSLAGYRQFRATDPWLAIHVGAVILGTACFAAGAAGSVAYLLADRQLRRKQRVLPMASLASLEKFIRHAIVLGFPLLTLAAITGILRTIETARASTALQSLILSPKFILTFVAWVLFALLLHVKIAPSLRGARAAWLCLLGFALLLAVFAAVNWMPHS